MGSRFRAWNQCEIWRLTSADLKREYSQSQLLRSPEQAEQENLGRDEESEEVGNLTPSQPEFLPEIDSARLPSQRSGISSCSFGYQMSQVGIVKKMRRG